MEIKFFEERDFVGKEVTKIDEAIKCFTAGMDIRDVDGDPLGDMFFGDKSEYEAILEITDSLKSYGKVYVGFSIGDHKVVPKDSTTLTCEFSEGQTVYFLLYGEIASGEVKCVSLATSKTIAERGQWRFSEAFRYGVSDDRERNCKFENEMSVIQEIFTKDCICINPKSEKIRRYICLPLDKVFSTKEKLVQDLLSKSC